VALSGGWLSRQREYIDPPEQLHTADPAHGITGDGDDLRAYAYSAPPASELGEGVDDYPGMEWVVESGGLVLDTTPTTHDPLRGDYGAARARDHAEPPLQFADERYLSARFESNDSPGMSEAALKRGLNGLPENNPEGFRRGWVEQFWVDRKFNEGERIHDARVNLPNTAYMEDNAPPPDEGTPYTVPFGSLQRMIDRTWNSPMLRREPPPFDESLMTDGVTDPTYYDPPTEIWVAG